MKPLSIRRINAGFTLIELSIVLVIIGLIIGGVLVGRDLIHAAQIRATVGQLKKEFNKHRMAFAICPLFVVLH